MKAFWRIPRSIIDILRCVFIIIATTLVVSGCSGSPVSPTPGRSRTPTTPTGGSSERFSITSANRTAPSDILEEVTYYPGGGIDGCMDYSGPGIELGFALGNGDELGTDIYSVSCGWEPEEKVQMTLERPDGKVFQTEQKAENWSGVYAAIISYETNFDDPPGIYVFTFKGTSGSLEERIRVSRPNGPRLYTHYLGKGELHLKYFHPNENVRLFAYGKPVPFGYEERAPFVGWQAFKVDSKGELVIKVSDTSLQYVIVGDTAGEVWPFGRSGGTRINGIHSDVLTSRRSGDSPPQPPPTSRPQPEPTSLSQPVKCNQPVYAHFESVWQRGGGASRGCPVSAAYTRNGAYQRFEKGIMIWHAGSSGDAGGMIYVIYDGGNWQEYNDTFVEGQMEKAGHQPPSGMLEPVRGFGKVWRDKLNGPSATIGWATSSEQASQVTIQPFPRTGVIISCDLGTYFLPDGVKWNQ